VQGRVRDLRQHDVVLREVIDMRTYRRPLADPDVDLERPVEVQESAWRFSPAQIAHALIGVLLLVLGVIAVARGDLSGDLNDPTFDLLGIQHNALIGIGEIIAGAILIVSAVSAAGRFLGVLVGIGLVVVGALVVGDDDTMQDLATEEALGWAAIVLGGLAILFGLIPGRRVSRQRTV
jgi:hypothetical protein